MPSWYAILVMAEKWGQLPWNIATGTSKLRWFLRGRFIIAQENKIAAKKNAR